jgi:hypothetical protein
LLLSDIGGENNLPNSTCKLKTPQFYGLPLSTLTAFFNFPGSPVAHVELKVLDWLEPSLGLLENPSPVSHEPTNPKMRRFS